MKTTTVNNTVKSLAVVAIAFVLTLATSLTSFANGVKDKKPASVTEEQVTVNYIGNNENSLIFRVEFENPTEQKFWLIIKNDAGDIVYHKQFSDAHFAKTVYFQKEEMNDLRPTFVIRNGNNEVVRQFSVNRTVVENTVVTKL